MTLLSLNFELSRIESESYEGNKIFKITFLKFVYKFLSFMILYVSE